MYCTQFNDFNISASCFRLGNACVANSSTSSPVTDWWFDNLRVWNRALNTTEIQQDMTNDQANPNELIGSWDGTLDSNGDLRDLSSNNQSGRLNGVIGVAITVNCTTGTT